MPTFIDVPVTLHESNIWSAKILDPSSQQILLENGTGSIVLESGDFLNLES